MIKSCHKNILETGTVSLAQGVEDPDCPLYRLYDRNIGRPFKTASAVTTGIRVDQGGAISPVDRLLIPAGHNLSGMTLDIKYSDDDIAYTTAVPQWVQSGNGLINKSWAATAARRYWKLAITTPASNISIPEIFLTQTYPWERCILKKPGGPFEKVFNVRRDESQSGLARFLIMGDPRRQRVYYVSHAGEAQKTNVLALNDAWQGAMPFWLCDPEGNWIFGEMRKPIKLRETGYRTYSFEFDFLEVIP